MSFISRLNEYLLIMGIPGLLVISFLDSAGVPLPGGPDTVILLPWSALLPGAVLLAWRRPEMAFLIIIAAAVGSMFGCLFLYGIGMKGGEKALARFSPEKTSRVMKKIRENAVWAVIAAVLAPPPFPTKLIILAAGVSHVGALRFMCSVLAGRLVRYSLIGFLAARYGDRAAQILRAQYPAFFLMLIGISLAILLIRYLRKRQKLPPPK